MIPVSPDIIIKYAVVAVAAAFLAFSILNYLDVRRNQNQRPKEEAEPKLIPRSAIEELKRELELERQYFTKEADPPNQKSKTLAEVLEELIMRRLADVSVSLTVEIPETTIKLFNNEAKLSGTVTITTQKQKGEGEVSESKFPVVIEEDEAEV